MEVKQKGILVKEEEELAYDQAEKKKKTRDGSRSSSSSCTTTRICQVDKCTADLGDAKQYHRRHRICEQHSKAQLVVVAGIRQRFCQQCSRFHELSEFDESKRSCRRRLAGHNERRRKNTTTDTQTEAAASSARKGTTNNTPTGTQLKDVIYGQVEERERIQIPIQEHHATNFKHFQIR